MRKIGFALALLSAAVATAAYAQSGISIRHTYYDRVAGEGDPVGHWILYCDNTVEQTGQITRYVIEEHYGC